MINLNQFQLFIIVLRATAPLLICSTRFFTRPLRFSNLEVSIDVARRLTDLPGFASGFNIHQEDFPVPSFCTRMKRLCRDKLWRIEFCKNRIKKINWHKELTDDSSNLLTNFIQLSNLCVTKCWQFPTD